MLVVIEGCDLTGKTTLARALHAELGGDKNCVVRHAGPPQDHPLIDYESSISDWSPFSTKSLVLDRFHLGELVWPKIFERESAMTLSVARHVELYLRSRGALLVHGTREPAKLMVALTGADPPEPIRAGHVPAVVSLFAQALDFSCLPRLDWNFDVHDEHETVELIIARGRDYAHEVRGPWLVTEEWVGSPNPEVLLVGDEFGLHREGFIDVPFAPWPSTSGHYLMRCLPDEWWRHCAIVNAHQGRDGQRTDLPRFRHTLGDPPVIALGKVAAACCDELDVPHTEIYHPQYWRRFHHHEPDSYTQLLREAALAGAHA